MSRHRVPNNPVDKTLEDYSLLSLRTFYPLSRSFPHSTTDHYDQTQFVFFKICQSLSQQTYAIALKKMVNTKLSHLLCASLLFSRRHPSQTTTTHNRLKTNLNLKVTLFQRKEFLYLYQIQALIKATIYSLTRPSKH